MTDTLKPSAAVTELREPRNLLLAAKATTIAIATIILYVQDLALVFNDAFKNEATSYILVVPILLVYLLFRKRKMLRATMSTEPENQPKNTRHIPTLAGILLCITAIVLYSYGSITSISLKYHILTLPIFTAGLILILFNPQTLRQALFPIALLATLTPLPSEALSGLGLTLLIAVFIAFIVRDKLWKKAATFVICFPLIYVLDILRMTIIRGIGYQFGEQLALDMFILLGGWVLIFFGTFILLAISERIFKIHLFKRKQYTCLSCTPQFPTPTGTYCHACGRIIKYPGANPKKADVAKIAAVALTTILLLSIQSPILALRQGPAQIFTDEPSDIQIFPNITGYTLQFYSRLTAREQEERADCILLFGYTPQEVGKEPVSVLIQIAEDLVSLPRWETRALIWPLTGTRGQPEYTQVELTNIQILQNPEVIARNFAFQSLIDNRLQLVLYWFQPSEFTINNTSQQKQVEISLITYPQNFDSIPNIKSQLLPIAKAIADYWQPIKTWAFINMTFSRQGLLAASLTAVFLIALSVFYIFELKRQITSNANAYRKLPQQSQQLIDSIQKTQATTLPTLNRISETYRTATGDTITATHLEQKIAELEETGIITSQIANDQDEPAHAWKPRMTFSLRQR